MKNKQIKIYFSEEDLLDLLEGRTFNWNYSLYDKKGNQIDVIEVELLMGNEADEYEEVE